MYFQLTSNIGTITGKKKKKKKKNNDVEMINPSDNSDSDS